MYKKEKWKDIVGEEGRYQVSTHGRVRSLSRSTTHKDGKVTTHKGRLLKLGKNHKGYPIAYMSYKVKAVHRLAMLAFKPCEYSHQLQVNHIDGDKTNNFIDNLEWVSNTENQRHAWATGLKTPLQGSKNHNSLLNENQVRDIKWLLLEGYSCLYLSKMYSVHRSTISKIKTGKNWGHIEI